MLALVASFVHDLSTALGLAAVCVGLLVAWRIARGGGGAAMAELERANGILERAIRELRERIDALEAENAELRGRTDVAVAIERSMETHEDRAQRRFEMTAVLMDMIARRLGPEPNGE